MNTAVVAGPQGVIASMAQRYDMDPVAFERTLRATVFPAEAAKEEFAAFLLVAKEFSLNPLLRQIYAFPKKGGGVVPIVPIDGWLTLTNRHEQFDGMEFVDRFDEAKPDRPIISITCRMYRKDRKHPTEITEYLAECQRQTEPWKQWPVRMLRHKATIQCARYAFSISGIFDEDEAQRIVEVDITPHTPAVPSGPTRLRDVIGTKIAGGIVVGPQIGINEKGEAEVLAPAEIIDNETGEILNTESPIILDLIKLAPDNAALSIILKTGIMTLPAGSERNQLMQAWNARVKEFAKPPASAELAQAPKTTAPVKPKPAVKQPEKPAEKPVENPKPAESQSGAKPIGTKAISEGVIQAMRAAKNTDQLGEVIDGSSLYAWGPAEIQAMNEVYYQLVEQFDREFMEKNP